MNWRQQQGGSPRVSLGGVYHRICNAWRGRDSAAFPALAYLKITERLWDVTGEAWPLQRQPSGELWNEF